MEYQDARIAYDTALDALQAAASKFDGLFPPRNTPIHLKTPGLNHDHLRRRHQELEAALSTYREAAARLADVARQECPDMLTAAGPVEPFDPSKLSD